MRPPCCARLVGREPGQLRAGVKELPGARTSPLCLSLGQYGAAAWGESKGELGISPLP